MATLTIRNMDETVKQALRLRAAAHGISMEEEARRILKEVIAPVAVPTHLGQHLLQRFVNVNSEAFSLPERQLRTRRPLWDEPA